MKPISESTAVLKSLLGASFKPTDANIGLDKANFPKLSIITPSFNQGAFLERTILSVLNQQYPNLEYIVIDGGSTDDSVEVIKKYEKHLHYWVSERDKGQVDALNKGLRIASGEWIGFQNSDDVYFPNTFDFFAKAAAEFPNTDMLYGDLYMIDTEDNVTELLKTNDFSYFCQLVEGMQVHNQSLFFRKKLVDEYGDFDQSFRFAFDYEFITRFAAKPGTTLARVPQLAGALRVHAEAKSSTISDVGREEHRKVVEKYQPEASRAVPAKMRYLCCRIRKMLLLAGGFDVAYIRHRLRRRVNG